MRRQEFVFSRFDPVEEVTVERFIEGAREFTVAVLGNDEAVATSAIAPYRARSASGALEGRGLWHRRR